jgi:hypothetical protein
VQQRANLAHLDATMRLFDPNLQPKDIRPKRKRFGGDTLRRVISL